MYKEHPLKKLVKQQKRGIAKGICSVCSSHPYVIEAAIEKAVNESTYVLIEATANQVNQYGGYTGMLPVDFAEHVKLTAVKKGLPLERLILGGDHLGPLVWKNEVEDVAMEKAEELIIKFVKAGFSKIHIDTSMHLGSDSNNKKLDTCVIAGRAAKLYSAAEKAFNDVAMGEAYYRPVYVIGSEVPVPGGTQEDEELKVTEIGDLEETLTCFNDAFSKICSGNSMENIIAVVVQPGVEFGEGSIHEYSREAAEKLSDFIKNKENIVFEGHSTDYQRSMHLAQMVEDGVAILKVGPALTFALREGLFALENIEKELFSRRKSINLSGFSEVLEAAMMKNPIYWEKYYHGDEVESRLLRKYSLSDRCRYYLSEKEVSDSIQRLINNLSCVDLPLTITSLYLPQQYDKIREGRQDRKPESLLKDKVRRILDMYPSF